MRTRIVVVAFVLIAMATVGAAVSSRQDHDSVRSDAAAAIADSVMARNQSSAASSPPPTTPAPTDETGTSGPGTSAASEAAHVPPAGVTASGPEPGSSTTEPTGSTAPPPSEPTALPPPPGSDGGGDVLDETDVVLLTPMLASLEFGSTVGFLLACNTGLGVVSSIGTEFPGLPEVLGPLLAKGSQTCGEVSATAATSLQQLNDSLDALEAANPASEPFFDALGQVFAALAELRQEVGPLGPTLAALGPIVDYFRAGS